MADPAALKARVEAYLVGLQADYARCRDAHAVELARLEKQIAATERVLAVWDTRVDALIERLTDAGIQIQA